MDVFVVFLEIAGGIWRETIIFLTVICQQNVSDRREKVTELGEKVTKLGGKVTNLEEKSN